MPAASRPVKNTKPAPSESAKSAAPAKAVKKDTKPAAAPAEAAPAAAENVVATPTVADTIASLEQEFSTVIATLGRLSSDLTKIKTELRAYHSHATREVKAAAKAKGRRSKPRAGGRPASGFVKPTLISNELATFLGVKAGTEMARTEVTKALHAYIQQHKLKNKDNGRIIEADGALSKLLKLQKGEQLTYFNLQKYMTPHFAKHTVTA